MNANARQFETDVTEQLVKEEVPSLEDFAEEVSGAWPNGWYSAEIIEGFQSRNGKQFTTEDTLSSKGDSRNAFICFRLSNRKGEDRTMFKRINYRESDFSEDRRAYVKEAAGRNKGTKQWDDRDAQRSSFALRDVGGLEKAIGFPVRDRHGNVLPQRAVDQKLDVKLTTTAEGFNEIVAFAKAGEMTKAKR